MKRDLSEDIKCLAPILTPQVFRDTGGGGRGGVGKELGIKNKVLCFPNNMPSIYTIRVLIWTLA